MLFADIALVELLVLVEVKFEFSWVLFVTVELLIVVFLIGAVLFVALIEVVFAIILEFEATFV